MKKLVLILFIVPFLLMGQTPEKNYSFVVNPTTKAVTRVYEDASKIVEKTYEVGSAIAPKIEQALGALGSSLKVSANQVWHILVRQQLVWSLCYLILTISALINWYWFYTRYISNKGCELQDVTRKKQKQYGYGRVQEENIETKKEYVNKTQNPWFLVVQLAICFTLSCFSFYNFTSMLTGFINPEFGAMKTIVEIASQIK